MKNVELTILTIMCISVIVMLISLIFNLKSFDSDLFNKVTVRFSELHKYSSYYNCVNYSRDYAIVMNLLGYEVYTFDNYSEKHAYNLIALEPQSGKIRGVNLE